MANAPINPALNDGYYNSTSGISYIWDGTIWQIIAQDGSDGAVGATGPQGVQGPTGLTGNTGPQGIPGADGAPGPQGSQGPQGNMGVQGVQGPQGSQGPAGPIGATGMTGPQGPAGANGAQGPQGIQGPMGPQGIAGPDAQTLSVTGNNLTITGGNTVALPPVGTLDQAYDFGGAGSGRIITADAGPFEVTTNSTAATGSAIAAKTTGTAYAIHGQANPASNANAAIYGENLRTNAGQGVFGLGDNGVVGQDHDLGADPNTFGVFANGNLGASGTKTFQIDHPTDPENKVLRHFSTESNEVLNIYRGNAVFDANGEAIITMPDYFDAINKNPSYNLTPVGGYAQLYIKEELNNGIFVIAGGTSGLKVSWTVYAERNDKFLQKHPKNREVELDKKDSQKGKYLMPGLYDQPANKGIFYINKEKK